MHTGPCTLLLALSFAPAHLLQTASAQAPSSIATSVPACTCPTPTPPPQHVQPFSLKQETTHIQTLPDGTVVKSVEETYNIRDAEGRSRREIIRTQNGEVDHIFQIYDYVTQTRYAWTVGASFPQVVTVYHLRSNLPPDTPPAPVNPQIAPRYYPQNTESLPPQKIAGIYATGTRITRTIPTGYEGNDHDLTVTTEGWSAPWMGLAVRYINDDPRTGKTITETTSLDLSTPDPALLQPPTGYELKEANQANPPAQAVR